MEPNISYYLLLFIAGINLGGIIVWVRGKWFSDNEDCIMNKYIKFVMKCFAIIAVAVFSFQLSITEVKAEASKQAIVECKKIKMGSTRFLGCWGDTSQVCTVKGDCDKELKEIME